MPGSINHSRGGILHRSRQPSYRRLRNLGEKPTHLLCDRAIPTRRSNIGRSSRVKPRGEPRCDSARRILAIGE